MARLPILNGRRFGCTACGNCCMEPGYVYFTYEEMQQMAQHLALGLAEFQASYGIEWDPEADTWLIDATDGQGCSLLDARRGCRVHPVKPSQCRTFPFWDELLDEASAWEASKEYCPGLDAPTGRLYAYGEIQKLRKGRGRT